MKGATLRGSGRGALALIGVVFVVAVAFGLFQRWDYIGTMTEGHHQWLMGDYVKWVEYWARDGIFADRFLPLESPRSIETTTFEQRIIYGSYPPGGLAQVFVLHKLLPSVPLVTLISLHGVAIQALVALTYALLVLWVLAPADRSGPALVLPLATLLTYLFHPAPYYFHPMTPLAFQAAMVPVALATVLEYALRADRERARDPRLLWAQSAVLAWLASCDWTFITLGVALTLFRLLSPLTGQYERGAVRGVTNTLLQLWALPALVIVLWALNLYVHGALDDLIKRALLRTGADQTMFGAKPLSVASVYDIVFTGWLGYTQYWLHAGALLSLVLFLRDRRDPAAVVCCVAALTPYLYVLMLPNDIVTHNFQALKFLVPVALVSFGIVPYRLIYGLRNPWRLGTLALMVWAWAYWLIDWRWGWESDWYQPQPPATQKLAEWLRANATFEEVYFSDTLQIAHVPPVPLAISYKRVWLQNTAQDLRAFAARLPPGAKPRLVSRVDHAGCFPAGSASVLPDGTHLYRVEQLTPAEIDCLAREWP